MKAERSLKARALQLLAQRDQSRLELRRKLVRHARKRDARDVPGTTGMPDAHEEPPDAASIVAEIEAVLVWLEGLGYLSVERFVESRVHAREGRFGNLRIRSDLAQHGLELPAETGRALAESELGRAREVRARRFAEAPPDMAARATQSRFLAARGFSPEVIRRLMRDLRTSVEAREPATGKQR